jgi:phenylacetate-coenzyme A ligase PaaK-like adenylate-forming protein
MAFQFSPLATMSALLQHSHASREHIRAFQDHHVRRLVTHAYENVPYYRRLFDQHGVKPGDIRGAADLPLIPITSKRDLQSRPVEEIVARGIDPTRLVTHRTSGSSGEPFTIRRSRFETRLEGVLRLRTIRELGLRVSDREASVVLRPTSAHYNPLPLRILQTLGLYRKVRVSCLLPPEDILRALRDFRPDVLSGFAGVLARLAQTVSGDDRSVIRPRFVAVGGEVLTPLMRRHITEAFSAPVFNLYASNEFNVIAWECQETGELHTCDDGVIVEVLKDGRPAATGERGEVVGTNLHSFAMPLIRYLLGDIVVKGSETCRCGQPFSTIRTVQGRMIDYFLLPGGRALHPYEIVIHLVDTSWIRQYQLVQEREDRVVLRVAPSFAPSPRQLASLEEAVSARLGQGVEFQVVLVPEIQIEMNGKFRVSRSLVRSAYDGIDWDNPQTAISSSVGEHRG